MTQIKTNYGLIEGCDMDGYVLFRGIPYAKAPVGALRFKAPERMEPWDGVFKADSFGKIAIEDLPSPDNPFTGRFHREFYSNPDFIREQSEDCLNLNIWTPENAQGKKLPVAFWIHGGGFSGGYSSELEFDGVEFCKKDVILVTIEYRCNVFGYLAHPWLDAENEKGISGNYGSLDQIAALEWVYENIEFFGGDPKNITVFGQSAGCMSTQVLVSSELTKDMIAKAIFQSGTCCEGDILFTPDLAGEEEKCKRLVELTGAQSIEELRAMSTEDIFEAQRKFSDESFACGDGLVLVPNVDNYLLKETVCDAWRNGNMKKIPYMLGSVCNDLAADPARVEKDLPGLLLEEDIRFATKATEVSGIPSYIYFFSRRLPGDDWGAFHSSELWYTFGTLGRCWRPMEEHDYELSREMITCWTNFMKTGNPQSEETEEWKPYNEDTRFVRQFR